MYEIKCCVCIRIDDGLSYHTNHIYKLKDASQLLLLCTKAYTMQDQQNVCRKMYFSQLAKQFNISYVQYNKLNLIISAARRRLERGEQLLNACRPAIFGIIPSKYCASGRLISRTINEITNNLITICCACQRLATFLLVVYTNYLGSRQQLVININILVRLHLNYLYHVYMTYIIAKIIFKIFK